MNEEYVYKGQFSHKTDIDRQRLLFRTNIVALMMDICGPWVTLDTDSEIDG